MRKVYDLDTNFATGEPTVQPIVLWGANGRPLREKFTKTSSEASDYIQAVQPQAGKTIVLVLALGAYETYDLNRNGDGFNEFPYKMGFKPLCGHSECIPRDDGWVTQSEVLPNHYKSFEQYGKIYKHHVNKDPTKAFGDVIKAFWNPQMHRVELLLGLDNTLAPDIIERISDGEYPAVSMGCRIKYDVCTECGHRAPTRAKYCDHLKYAMRQVGKRGLRHGALNPAPKFFDISFVVKPADQTGYMLKKVAYELHSTRLSADNGAYLDNVDEKRAAIQKISDIDKTIRGIPVDHKVSPLSAEEGRMIERYRDTSLPQVVRGMPEMDHGTIRSLSSHSVPEVLSTLSSAGVILTTPEFVRLLVQKLSPGAVVPEEALDAIVSLQGHVFDLYAKYPQMLDQAIDTGLFDINAQNVRPEIAGKAQKYLEKRSTIGDYLTRQVIPPQMRQEEPPWTDTLHVRDPVSGASHVTTRGAARDAHDEIAKRQLTKMVGGAALLGGAYKLLAPGIPNVLRPVALGTAGLIGAKHLRPDWGPQYMTEEGVPISTMTELTSEKGAGDFNSTALPVLGTAALVTALGHDYDSRLRRGAYVHNPAAPVYQRMYDRLGEYTSNHPALAFLGGLAGYGALRGAVGKFAAYMGDLETRGVGDSVALPDVNFDRASEKIGSVILR